ncbi:MAG: 5-formyltetrahydrofolate cyclo-ligase [Acutalibacteraceae bacterium]|nr:5-formyltetrahydrofolate cyclo-ligase [Acutalibacteraceae bacterium]
MYTVLYSAHIAMYKNSLKACKTQLRRKYKTIRNNISSINRKLYSDVIVQKIFNLQEFKNAETVFVYVNIGDEVETLEIIKKALQLGKKVAVPYCIPNTCLMDFYYIDSINQLQKGSFGVPEPNPNCCKKAEVKKGLIIVPALSFDLQGYRMGYGKGYYDRYLSDFFGVSVGICYSHTISKCTLRGVFDRRVNYIITEKFVKFIAK